MAINIYDMATWPNLKTRRLELRDALWDLEQEQDACQDKLNQLALELDSIEDRLKQGETHEFPW